jgi:geranylgeranyl transferase type-2 subunit beta
MDSVPYLPRLTARLSDGLLQLPAELRTRHANYLRTAQGADGGFAGREGGSDLYYTAFALRGLAVLDALTPEVADRASDYLRQALRQSASVVDFFSLLYACLLLQTAGGPDVLRDSPADWPERVAATLETLHTADGGYAKTAGAASASTYHTFLVGLCYQLLGRPLPRPEEVLRFVASRHREDGGYVEVAPMRRGGTNPTAAAVGLLQMALGPAFAPAELSGVADFLAGMVSPEGGLQANARAPLADLLSTFTGCWTLEQFGALSRLDLEAVRDYARSVELPGGGFRGGLWDQGHDVEYTFYGLGVLALLA